MKAITEHEAEYSFAGIDFADGEAKTVFCIISRIKEGAMKINEAGVKAISQLKAIAVHARPEDIDKYCFPLNLAMRKFGIDTPLRKAHFLAQVIHESGHFRYVEENLNYSAGALRMVFRKYFPVDAMAEKYAGQPEAIANRVYANRMENGDERSGDGWRYRGRGLIQLTGRRNYRRCGNGIGANLEDYPDVVAENTFYAVTASAWYWRDNNLNWFADKDDIEEVTRAINGGLNGLRGRHVLLEKAKKVIVEEQREIIREMLGAVGNIGITVEDLEKKQRELNTEWNKVRGYEESATMRMGKAAQGWRKA